MSNGQITGSSGNFQVSGELGFATVNEVLVESEQTLFAVPGERLDIDLGKVSRVDSAGLALLIEWMRMARRHQMEVCFHHLPEQLLAIARAGELDGLLPVVE